MGERRGVWGAGAESGMRGWGRARVGFGAAGRGKAMATGMAAGMGAARAAGMGVAAVAKGMGEEEGMAAGVEGGLCECRSSEMVRAR